MNETTEDIELKLRELFNQVGLKVGHKVTNEDFQLAFHNFSVAFYMGDPTAEEIQKEIEDVKLKHLLRGLSSMFEEYEADKEYDISVLPYFVKINPAMLDKGPKADAKPADSALITEIWFETVDGQLLTLVANTMNTLSRESKLLVAGTDDWVKVQFNTKSISDDGYKIIPKWIEGEFGNDEPDL